MLRDIQNVWISNVCILYICLQWGFVMRVPEWVVREYSSQKSLLLEYLIVSQYQKFNASITLPHMTKFILWVQIVWCTNDNHIKCLCVVIFIKWQSENEKCYPLKLHSITNNPLSIDTEKSSSDKYNIHEAIYLDGCNN